MTTTLFLVRHGEVESKGAFYGHLDVKLTARGLEQAAAAASRLKGVPLASVQSSDLSRAFEGARLVAEVQGLTPTADPAFREMSLGVLEGIPHVEAMARTPELVGKSYRDMWSYRFPGGGESLADIEDRANPALERLLLAHPDQCVALVAHNSVNRVILGRALGLPLKDVFDFSQDFGCINRVDYTPAEEGGFNSKVRLINWTPGALNPPPH